MKSQNTILLSLGTNMGNKLENLETCIMAIHNTIATVVEVSKVYETPAWGFEGAAFYNCAIAIHTHKSAQKLLS
uniref:2-amino-4-hydroxy-6- hydroxymethyldihydropteridine diphosphokinase n=1 Tax=Flavobacterium sp. TaxID=239 RepID=UPI0037BFB8BA